MVGSFQVNKREASVLRTLADRRSQWIEEVESDWVGSRRRKAAESDFHIYPANVTEGSPSRLAACPTKIVSAVTSTW